jgi:ABC-type branched-subunit amino acid transport system substrate-binding protein
VKLRLFLLVAALISAGCATNGGVKPHAQTTTTLAATPAPTAGVTAPSPADFHVQVTDQDYQSALAAVGTSDVNRFNADSYLTIAQYQCNRSDFAGALKTYQKILAAPGALPQMEKAQYMLGQVYYDKKDFLPAIAAFQNAMQKYPASDYAGQSRQMMEFILGYSMSQDDLRSFVANYSNSPMNCFALFQLGSHESQAGMQTEAIDHLNSYIQQCPEAPSVGAAKLLVQSLQSQVQGKTWKIGVLVPRTGKFKSLGQSVLNGVLLAMEQAKQGGNSQKTISVIVRDTGSEGLAAVTLFQDMTKDQSLDAVIGPAVPSDIPAIASLANERRITMICPAIGRDGLSSVGPYVFSNCITNEMQGRAIAKYAVEHMGFKRFGILSPADGDAQARADAFQKMVEAMGGTVTAAVTYPPYSVDFKKEIVALGGQDPESSKENDRENNRRLEELKYNITKEIGKILLKAKETADSSVTAAENPPALAVVPFVEGLTNTTCPSVVAEVNKAIKDSLKDQPDYVLRSDDLVQQALTRLPIEFKGNTQAPTAVQWADVASDLNASLLIVGRVVETNPPNDWGDHSTWDYSVAFEAYQINQQKAGLNKIYQSHLLYSVFKPAALVRTNSTFQALYLPAHPQEIPSLVSQLHFYDMSPVFLGSHTWENDMVLQEAVKDVEGSYFVTGFYADSQMDNVKKFVEDYLKEYAARPDFVAAQSYDAARLLLKATDSAITREDIRNNLAAIKDFDGVSGKTTFGGHGEADKVVPVLKIQGGKYQQVQ